MEEKKVRFLHKIKRKMSVMDYREAGKYDSLLVTAEYEHSLCISDVSRNILKTEKVAEDYFIGLYSIVFYCHTFYIFCY